MKSFSGKNGAFMNICFQALATNAKDQLHFKLGFVLEWTDEGYIILFRCPSFLYFLSSSRKIFLVNILSQASSWHLNVFAVLQMRTQSLR